MEDIVIFSASVFSSLKNSQFKLFNDAEIIYELVHN